MWLHHTSYTYAAPSGPVLLRKPVARHATVPSRDWARTREFPRARTQHTHTTHTLSLTHTHTHTHTLTHTHTHLDTHAAHRRGMQRAGELNVLHFHGDIGGAHVEA